MNYKWCTKKELLEECLYLIEEIYGYKLTRDKKTFSIQGKCIILKNEVLPLDERKSDLVSFTLSKYKNEDIWFCDLVTKEIFIITPIDISRYGTTLSRDLCRRLVPKRY